MGGTGLSPAKTVTVRHIRFHGRGGEGVKLASRIVSRAAFLAGLTVQDSPLYGAERRGAPVVAFARLSERPIYERGYIETPDIVVSMDDSLFGLPAAGVLDGLTNGTLVLANSVASAAELRARHAIAGRVVTLDVSSIALDVLGHHLLSAPVAGFTVKAASIASWERLAEAVHVELTALRLPADLVDRNLRATRCAFERASAVPVLPPSPPRAASNGVRPTDDRPRRAAPAPPFVIPHLTAQLAAPLISAPATSAERSTAGWRVYRPRIDLARCSRCMLCFALCPEGAIRLDEQSYPVVDYDHCKGCLICVEECPPHAVSQERERAA